MTTNPTYAPKEVDFHFVPNASLAMLTSANQHADAISGNMMQMVNLYLTDLNANTTLAQNEQDEVTKLMQGNVSDNFDGNDSDNDPQIWGDSDNEDDSNKINIVQTDITNATSWYKSMIGIDQAATSSGTSWLQSTQQNQKQLFTYMNGANGQQDYTGSLLGSPLL